MNETPKTPHAHLDPITGAPGAHPVGTGVGATGGGVAGAAIGSIAGPVGTIIGAAVGAIAGGLAGKGVAEMVDPTAEDAYWLAQHPREPYFQKHRTFDFYAPAYRAGYEGRAKYDGLTFDDAEADVQKDFLGYNGDPSTWKEVRPASLSAWNRIDGRAKAAHAK